MNRFKQVIFTVLACLFVVSVYSCGPTDKPTKKTASKKIKQKPPPHWADGVLDDFSISEGLDIAMIYLSGDDRYKMDAGAITFLKMGTYDLDRRKNDYHPYNPYTADIAVFSLKEMGFKGPTTMPTIVKRFREHGYRPLTLREVANLRLHFKDQPQMKNGHKIEAFYTLPDENFQHPAMDEWKYLFFLENDNYSGKVLEGENIYDWEQDTFDIVKKYPGNKAKVDIAFAAVKIGSEKLIIKETE